jgi:hypothetical protein
MPDDFFFRPKVFFLTLLRTTFRFFVAMLSPFHTAPRVIRRS